MKKLLLVLLFLLLLIAIRFWYVQNKSTLLNSKFNSDGSPKKGVTQDEVKQYEANQQTECNKSVKTGKSKKALNGETIFEMQYGVYTPVSVLTYYQWVSDNSPATYNDFVNFKNMVRVVNKVIGQTCRRDESTKYWVNSSNQVVDPVSGKVDTRSGKG